MASSDRFDRLLDALPRIAEAVNTFTSEDVQKAAFTALVAALSLPGTAADVAADHVVPAADPPGQGDAGTAATTATGVAPTVDGSSQDSAKRPGAKARSPRTRKAAAAVSAVKGLNFWPADKPSLPDFVAEKAPTNNKERNLLAVYYLEQVLEIEEITAGHVLGVYKECKWPEPSAPVNALHVTASNTHWIDTADSKAIKTTPGGRNMVEHTMPVPEPAKKKAPKVP